MRRKVQNEGDLLGGVRLEVETQLTTLIPSESEYLNLLKRDDREKPKDLPREVTLLRITSVLKKEEEKENRQSKINVQLSFSQVDYISPPWRRLWSILLSDQDEERVKKETKRSEKEGE